MRRGPGGRGKWRRKVTSGALTWGTQDIREQMRYGGVCSCFVPFSPRLLAGSLWAYEGGPHQTSHLSSSMLEVV